MATLVTRRGFIKSGATLAALAPWVSRSHAAEGAPPNIIFSYTDDQAPWALTKSGYPDIQTPNMDRLFDSGAYLPWAFTATPVCSPSRAELMTSRYGTEVGITDWLAPGGRETVRGEDHIGLDPKFTSWVKLLKDAGYYTALVGKWHLGVRDEFHPTRHGYEHFMGFRGGGTKVVDPELEVNGETKPFQGLTVDILTNEAIRVIRERPKERPFMLSLHFRSPHAPWLPVADEDAAPYKDLNPFLPNPDYPELDIERLKQVIPEYFASVTGVDRNLGRLLAVLDELGLAENTIVIHTSDNGYNMGHNGIWHKGNGHYITTWARDIPGNDARIARPNMFDCSVLLPTGIRWPGVIKPGTIVDECVTNLDWFPTLLAMAGAGKPGDLFIYGRDFSPLLRGESIPWDNDVYGEYSQHHYVEADMRMYRTREWKLVRDFKRPGHDELYHLAEDPSETTNRIEDPVAQEIRKALDEKLLAQMRRLKDPVLPA